MNPENSTAERTPGSLHPAGSAESLANKIVLDILTTHDGRVCHRIQKLSGQYPDNEHGEGGLCQSALESLIVKHLLGAGYPPNSEIRRVADNPAPPKL